MSETNRKHKEHQVETKSRIDSKAQIIDPIDFSFKDILNFEELKELLPRFGLHHEPKKRDGKYISTSLKLGYNALTDINGLFDWCSQNFTNEILSLDLSFNCFSNISMEITKFKELKCLYLHGNKISDLSEIDKLAKLKNLTTLSVHGNPFENIEGFRFYILCKIPTLKHLNFCGVSKAEVGSAVIWIRSNKQPLKLQDETIKLKKRSKNEDD